MSDFKKYNPDYQKIVEDFAYDEVLSEESVSIDSRKRHLVIIAAVIGCQGRGIFSEVVQRALDDSLSPSSVMEVAYQATDYVGMARAYEFISMLDDILLERGISLPLRSEGTTTKEDRFQKGLEKQMAFFGPQMKESANASVVGRWLASNCFGDYYTRTGLSDQEREMITFCFLFAQGGCEPQMRGHIVGNINVGNDADFLKKVVHNCLPYVGYPRSLTAINVINEVTSKKQ